MKNDFGTLLYDICALLYARYLLNLFIFCPSRSLRTDSRSGAGLRSSAKVQCRGIPT